jgi:hypothetical protein
MTLSEIELHIGNTTGDPLLYDEKNFDARADAIDFLEFHILDQFNALGNIEPDQLRLIALQHRAEEIKLRLEEIDNKLFQKLQREIREGKYSGEAFETLVKAYINFENTNDDEEGYDNLDVFISRLLSLPYMPEQSQPLEPEMVFYQKTPARIVFELVKDAGFTKDDVFFDIGSGLGQVAMLVNLLTGIKTVGVEFEPAFCKYSQNCVAMLGLQDVAFTNADARKADYRSGTVFFMYTPFRGKMLEDVLEGLRAESLLRKIKIITYGPCTPEVAAQEWLYPDMRPTKNTRFFSSM